MQTSTGTETSAVLQFHLDRLSAECMDCAPAARQAAWEAGLALISRLPGVEANLVAFQDAVQDAGHRLGLFHANARATRFYGVPMGCAQR